MQKGANITTELSHSKGYESANMDTWNMHGAHSWVSRGHRRRAPLGPRPRRDRRWTWGHDHRGIRHCAKDRRKASSIPARGAPWESAVGAATTEGSPLDLGLRPPWDSPLRRR